ncbi:hypothetical protein AAC387_Pa06g1706 [Persea americana]
MRASIYKNPSHELLLALGFCCIYIFCAPDRTQAQATTDPSEVRALNSIFQKWRISAPTLWNTTGDPCTGSAIDSTKVDSSNINPAIKCDCSFDNGTTCHLRELKVLELDVTGTIPVELLNLSFVFNLNLGRNYLTGLLPPFIGNFTTLQYLNFGGNALSGSIPKELGNLQNLLSLGLGANNFSGSLPPELGNLVNLQQFYIDSAGLSGEIPSTFANLKNLQILRLSDNQFTGQIPDFIGNWTKLTILRIQGNSFQGPIPSSFSRLTELTDLRISEMSNGSSSLDFIKDMKALSILILRNDMISGTIPSNIGEYQALQQLFLGNNRLSGSLPSQKSASLVNIDLSYNEFSGGFPSWATQQSLLLNLVANNFTVDNSNRSIFLSGLNCLQRNFPCNRGSPRYSSFAINCGGQSITSSDGIVFENENETLGAASYYVTDTQKWAVSNVGRFVDSKNAEYTRNTLSPFTNTLDTELFQSARLSPGSLRYYGLGLENGNYTVKLLFGERDFANSPTFSGVGRRAFDIYVQGNLVFKEFNIKKEAGGSSFKAVQKVFEAQVVENFLEIHLFWAGKGTCCVPVAGYYGPSISAISVTPDFTPTVSNHPPTSTSTKKTSLIVGIVVSVGVVSIISITAIYILRRWKRLNTNEDEELLTIGSRPATFRYGELRAATDNFSPANKLGEGGFGPVYKGVLPDNKVVAIKQLSLASHQGKNQFITEIATISAVQHRNLVKLYGCCIEGDRRLLVYEYLENKSLDQALFGKNNLHLNWSTRYEICLGTARGLAYLHEESRIRIVHRDVKASNILLDAVLNPKISDFGLAKLYDDKMTHISTRVAGTIGYLAPEYAMLGHLTEKVDVFGFGVVALEILTGKPNSYLSMNEEKIYLLERAWSLHEEERHLELVDPMLAEYNEGEAMRVIGVALLCTQASPTLRPPMSRVVAMLTGDAEVGTAASRPGYLTDWQFNDRSSVISGERSNASTGRTTNTNSQCETSSCASGVLPAYPSPKISNPMLNDVIEHW